MISKIGLPFASVVEMFMLVALANVALLNRNWPAAAAPDVAVLNCIGKPAAAPVGPVGPVFPVGPVAPVGPVFPVGPVGPVLPVNPVGPVAPVGPPAGPVGPTAPCVTAPAKNVIGSDPVIVAVLLDSTIWVQTS